MSNFTYYNPVKINFNLSYENIVNSLKTDSILLLTSKSFYKKGLTKILEDKLGGRLKGLVYNILPNPEISYAKFLKKDYKNYKEIIAFGGGSVLDMAKYFSVLGNIVINKGNLDISSLCSFAPIYAIPTTAGTSSELTKWATLWDTPNNIKFSLSNEKLYCKEAFYDPSLFLNIPKEITIYTALDALSHSIESIWNKNSNFISTSYAIKAIELILEYLPRLQNDLNSKQLRLEIILASIYAGLAFSNTQTALAHAISYPITMKLGIPHGLACSFTIPILLDCINDVQTSNILSIYREKIISLFHILNISTNLRSYGITRQFIEDIFNNLNSRAKNGMFDLELTKKKFLSHVQ